MGCPEGGYSDTYWQSVPLGHVGGGNRCGGDTCRGLLQHTLANGALVYPSQGGRYRAEGCIALG
jgi:hypothetical protein